MIIFSNDYFDQWSWKNGILVITYSSELFSNVRKCWLAMPLGAGFLRWVLACHTIEKKTKEFNFCLAVAHFCH